MCICRCQPWSGWWWSACGKRRLPPLTWSTWSHGRSPASTKVICQKLKWYPTWYKWLALLLVDWSSLPDHWITTCILELVGWTCTQRPQICLCPPWQTCQSEAEKTHLLSVCCQVREKNMNQYLVNNWIENNPEFLQILWQCLPIIDLKSLFIHKICTNMQGCLKFS